MRAPPGLASLLEDGLIEAVLRPLQSGKEAQVYLVRCGGEVRIAKIYKAAEQRNFKNRSAYQEGRGTRNTRDQRAMKRRSTYGRSRDEEAWQSTEVEMIQRLSEAGVRVPKPFVFSEGVLIMELVQDADGAPAPRLGDLRVSAADAVAIHDALLRDVVRMLCAGVVHGDLSEFNVLIDEEGPVIIDLPQAVDASSNPNAKKLLLRDVANLQRFVTRWVPGRKPALYAEEMWALYELNGLEPDTELTGVHEGSTHRPDTDALLGLIADAEEEETMRRLHRGMAPLAGGGEHRPRVHVNQDKRSPQLRRKPRKARTQPATPAAPPPKPLSRDELIARALAARTAAAAAPTAAAPPAGGATGGKRRGRKRRSRSGDRPPMSTDRTATAVEPRPGADRRSAASGTAARRRSSDDARRDEGRSDPKKHATGARKAAAPRREDGGSKRAERADGKGGAHRQRPSGATPNRAVGAEKPRGDRDRADTPTASSDAPPKRRRRWTRR
jgi:RIO kinase 1